MAEMYLLYSALVCLIAPVFAEYAKIRKKAERAFNWIAAGGVSFILAAAFTLSFWTYAGQVGLWLQYLFEFIGWIYVLIGALLALVEFAKK